MCHQSWKKLNKHLKKHQTIFLSKLLKHHLHKNINKIRVPNKNIIKKNKKIKKQHQLILIINNKKFQVEIVKISKNNKFLKLILIPFEKINNEINKKMNKILQFLKLMNRNNNNINKFNNKSFKGMKMIINNKCKLMKTLWIVYIKIFIK